MITEWLMSIGVMFSDWFASLFPPWDIPEFFASFDDTVNQLFANLSGVGVWADWVYIFVVVAAVILVWGMALLVKVFRALIAHVPFFGGKG